MVLSLFIIFYYNSFYQRLPSVNIYPMSPNIRYLTKCLSTALTETPTIEKWLTSHLTEGATVGVDPHTFTRDEWAPLQVKLQSLHDHRLNPAFLLLLLLLRLYLVPSCTLAPSSNFSASFSSSSSSSAHCSPLLDVGLPNVRHKTWSPILLLQ